MLDKVLVVGAGIAGSCVARLLASEGFSVDIYEKEKFVSGTCLDYLKRNYYKQAFGSHIFRTDDSIIWDWLNVFGKFNNYQHKVLGMVDGELIPIPVNLNTIQKIFSPELFSIIEGKLYNKFGWGSQVSIKDLLDSRDKFIHLLGEVIYEKVYKNYTLKQWGTEDVDESVLSSIKIRVDKDDRYFKEKYQGVPVNGWTNLIKNMLKHKNIKVYKNKKFIFSKDISEKYKAIFYSGCLDELFSFRYGELPYRGLVFDFEITKNDYRFNNLPAVVNYPNNYNFTRISYFNKLLPDRKFNKMCLCREYPFVSDRKVILPLYPIKSDESLRLYNKYLKLCDKNKIIPIGRLGLFKYMNIDQTLKTCFEAVRKFGERKYV